MTTKLILIRHGETDWNIEGKYLGHTDIDLNRKGRKQIRALCKVMEKERIHKVYSSDLKRAVNSSKIIFKDFAIEKVPELREINFGVFEGLTYEEIVERHATVYKEWVDDPFKASVPRGEQLKDFKKRVLEIFKKILKDNKNKIVAIVTHSGPIRIIVSDVMKLKDVWKVEIDNASITIIKHANKKANVDLLNYRA